MWMAVTLVAIVVAVVWFHAASPWWITPLASNWQRMDDTLAITLVVTGIFFVVLHLLLAWMLLRFRHRPGRRAHYQPENHRLERWLIGLTALGIVALLAPGLYVYAEYVSPPRDALVVEVLGQQWQWRYRFAGAGGELGRSDARLVDGRNPFGLDERDAAAADDVLVNGNELHLPLNRPVKLLMRSIDALHDFYVPPLRARMNMVPGMVTSFWFTPTQSGRFEVLCAQLCGLGHAAMRGYVVVEDDAAFQAWLRERPTFAATRAPTTPLAGEAQTPVQRGQALALSAGCAACHSVDGSPGAGPSWKGLYGSRKVLSDGSHVIADAAYLERSIRDPQAQVVQGFAPIMPKLPLSEEQLTELMAYIKSLGDQPR